MAKQNAVSKIGQENMLSMIDRYSKAELCHLMGIGYDCFLDDNRELHIPCPVLLIVGEKDIVDNLNEWERCRDWLYKRKR